MNRPSKSRKYLIPPEARTMIYQPNRITNAIYDYSLIQEKVFNTVIFHLQKAIDINIKGGDYFKYFNSNSISKKILIDIPLKDITDFPQQYTAIKESIKEFASLVFTIRYWDAQKKEMRVKFKGLFSADLPEKANYASCIRFEFDPDVVKQLVEIDLNENGRPFNYTRFAYEITKAARCKYTSRVYKLLCSYRSKGYFTFSIEDFKMWLGISGKYRYYRDIKKYILIPVQRELQKRGDCWFNCNDKNFTKKNRKTVTHLNFSIITPDLLEENEKKKDHIRQLLRMHFQFRDKEIEEFNPILRRTVEVQSILEKINYLFMYCNEHRKEIENKTSYVLRSLLAEFNKST